MNTEDQKRIEARTDLAMEGVVEPKFPLTIVVLVPHEKRFETYEEFDEYMRNDLLEMGYVSRDEEDENRIVWDENDKESWKRNYDDVPFPPKTVAHFVSYVKQDVENGNYALEELDFEPDDNGHQWFIREEKAE